MFPSRPPLLLAAVLAGSSCSTSAVFSGQTRVVRFGGASADDRLAGLNRRIDDTRKRLVRKVGADPGAERA
ncbi:MAG: hypothetical protein JNK82_31460, partial [Myxococcaceae bacterium]|nr:hypothetical protein [Myxococcaceae bacterium]